MSGGRASISCGMPMATFSFYFSIYLTDLPDLKFDYDQTTFED